MNKAQELESKILEYSKALDQIKLDLSQKRSEMAVLAKKRLSDLETEIPSLEKITEEKRNKIADLDKIISEKSSIALEEYDSCKAKFENMEKEIKAYLSRKEQDIKNKENSLYVREEEVRKKNINLAERENSLVIEKQGVIEEGKILNQQSVDLFNSKENFEKYKQEVEKGFDVSRNEISQKYSDLELRTNDLSKRMTEVIEREKEAKNIIEREKEFDLRQKTLQDARVSLEDKAVSLNQEKVKLIAEGNRLKTLQKELEVKDKNIQQRENLVKQAEAKIGA